jgi:hypothetical protein
MNISVVKRGSVIAERRSEVETTEWREGNTGRNLDNTMDMEGGPIASGSHSGCHFSPLIKCK